MADHIRDAVIGIDWKIDISTLERANAETDRMIERATRAGNTYSQSARGIDEASSALNQNARSIRQNTENVNEFGSRSRTNLNTVRTSARSTEQQVDRIGRELDESTSSARQFGTRGSRSVDNVGDSARTTGARISSLSDISKKASTKIDAAFTKAKIAVVALGTATVAAGKKAFEYASDTNEALNKVEVAFGDNNASVKQWSESTRKNIGLARGTALDLAAGYGDMATSMGVNTAEAADMSTAMVNLAGDLASFKNQDIDRINTALNGVFTGETEALKGLGIVMTQTNLEAFALEKGFLTAGESSLESAKKSMALEKAQVALNSAIEKNGASSIEARDAQIKFSEAQEKANESASAALSTLKQDELVRLRYAYVMDKTTNAQGDFARTNTEAANATRVLSETVKETADKMGQKLIPIFTPLIVKATEFVEKGEMIPDMLEKASAKVAPFARELTTHFNSAKEYFVNDLLPVAQTVVSEFGPGMFEGAKQGFETFGWALETLVVPPLLWLKEFAEENPEKIRDIGKYAGLAVTGLIGFKTVGSQLLGVTTKVLGLVAAVKKIGSTALTSAAQARAGFNQVSQSATAAQGATRAATVGSRLRWFTGGSAATGGTTATATAATTAARHAGTATIGSRIMGGVSKVGGAVKGVAKAIPGVSYLAAATNLIGTNKDNVGEKVGGSLGSLIGGALASKTAAVAGAKLGAVMGTTFGPLGTAIGGILGTGAGMFFGSAIGKALQKNWKGLSKWAEDHPILGAPVRFVNQGIEVGKNVVSGVKKAYNSAKDFFADPFKNAGKVKSGDGVSKDSAKAVNAYMDLNNSVVNSQMKLKITGKPMTEAEFGNIMETYDKMEKQVVDSLSAKQEKSDGNIDKLMRLGNIDQTTADSAKATGKETAEVRTRWYKETSNKLKDLEQKQQEESVAATQQYEERIKQIKQKASDEKRALSESELNEIARNEEISRAAVRVVEEKYAEDKKKLNKELQSDAVVALSESAKEQKIILSKLQEDASELSAKQAADIVSNSYKAKEETVKTANEKYDETIALLDEEYRVHGTISQQQYEQAVQIAKEERDGTVSAAEETHDEVVRHAKEQADGHLNQVDWETGETLSKWDVFKNDASAKFTEIKDGAMDIWNSFSSGFASTMASAVTWGLDAWDGFVTNFAGAVNSVISGINAVFDFFGINQLKKWTPTASSKANVNQYAQGKGGKQYASGKNDSYSGQALVGEEGVELAYSTNGGNMRLLGANGPEITHVSSGERILNHRDTTAVLSGGMGSGLVLPGFADGKGGAISEALGVATDLAGDAWNKTKEVAGNVVNSAKAGIETAKEWLGDPIGQVKALVDKHNIFKKESKVGGIGFGTLDKIKTSGAEWIKNKLEEFKDLFSNADEATGSGAYAPHFGSPFVRTSEYGSRPNLYGDFHTGIDYGAPMGTPLPAQYDGQVTQATTTSVGLGTYVAMQVAKGLQTFYGHMQSLGVKTGDTVKAGQIIGKVGSSGWSTGPHVHYELQKDGKHVNPDTYGAAEGSSTAPAGTGVERWRPTIEKALTKNGLPSNATYTNAWLRQVQSESGGNEKAVQGGYVDVNTLSGDLAKGLLQTISATFNAYKHAGHNDIFNGYDNSLAAINYAKNRYGSTGMLQVIGHGHGYAKGGRPSKGETVLVGENGPELFEADTAGTVHSYEKTQGLFKNATPAINFSPTVNIEVNGNAESSVTSDIKKAVQQVLEEEYSKLLTLFKTGGVV